MLEGAEVPAWIEVLIVLESAAELWFLVETALKGEAKANLCLIMVYSYAIIDVAIVVP